MTFSNWITIISCAGAVFASLIGGTWILSWKLSDLSKEQAKELSIYKSEVDGKINRGYSRLDEYKVFIEAKMKEERKDMASDFVCKNVCKILHDQNDKNFERVEAKVDTLAVKFDEGIREIMKAMQSRG